MNDLDSLECIHLRLQRNGTDPEFKATAKLGEFLEGRFSRNHALHEGNKGAIAIPAGSTCGHYVTLITQRSVVQIHPPQQLTQFPGWLDFPWA